MSYIDVILAPPLRRAIVRNVLGALRVVARAVLRSLQQSRERAARKIIQDYRHLNDSDNRSAGNG